MVDTSALLSGVVGVGAAFLAVTFLVIMYDQLGNTPGLSNDALLVTGNATSALGSIATTWGTIIILGIVILSVFIAILAGLMFLVRRGGR